MEEKERLEIEIFQLRKIRDKLYYRIRNLEKRSKQSVQKVLQEAKKEASAIIETTQQECGERERKVKEKEGSLITFGIELDQRDRVARQTQQKLQEKEDNLHLQSQQIEKEKQDIDETRKLQTINENVILRQKEEITAQRIELIKEFDGLERLKRAYRLRESACQEEERKISIKQKELQAKEDLLNMEISNLTKDKNLLFYEKELLNRKEQILLNQDIKFKLDYDVFQNQRRELRKFEESLGRQK